MTDSGRFIRCRRPGGCASRISCSLDVGLISCDGGEVCCLLRFLRADFLGGMVICCGTDEAFRNGRVAVNILGLTDKRKTYLYH